MNFKKNAIKTAIVTAGLAGSSMSMAGTWAPATAPFFATEIFGVGNTGSLEPGPAVYTLGAIVGNGSQNVTFTLSGATWGDNGLTSSSLSYTNSCVATAGGKTDAMTFSLVDGGANTDSTAAFRVTTAGANTGGTRINDTITLQYNVTGVTSLATATSTAGPTIAFGITDTVGNVDSAGAATIIAKSIGATSLAGVATAAGDSKIDVSNGTTRFTTPTAGGGGTLAFDAGSFTITDAATGANGVTSNGFIPWNAGNAGEAAVTATTVTLTGDFTASLGVDTNLDANTSQGEGVILSGCQNKNATTLTATTATFTLTSAETLAALNTACDVTINVDGTTVIPEFTPALTVAVDYTLATAVDESLSLNLASVSKDGSTAAANLLLNPTGAYDNFIRVSNASAVSGAVFATLYNDSGTSVTFTLLSSLAAQASSDLISVDDLYASAQAADATFDVGTGKLRGTFTGEFANLSVQNISTSTDGTTFFTF